MNQVLLFLLRVAERGAEVTLTPQEAYRRQALQKFCGSTTPQKGESDEEPFRALDNRP